MLIRSKKLNILVIDNSNADYPIIKQFIEDKTSQLSISRVNDLIEAKEVILNSALDIIFLDITGVSSDLKNLIEDSIEMAGKIPVIVIAGHEDSQLELDSLSLGASDCLFMDSLSRSQLSKSIYQSIERKKFNQEIEDSEKKYRELFHFSPIPMWVFDIETLHFLYVNEAAEKRYGYTQEEFLNLSIRDLRPREDISKLDALLKATNNRADVYSGINKHVTKNGQLVYVDIKSNIINFEGKTARLVSSLDVTERYKYIQAIEEQNKKLKELYWMQSNTLRGPIVNMMGLINLLQDQSIKEDDAPELLQYTMDSVQELDDIIRKIIHKTQQIELEKPGFNYK